MSMPLKISHKGFDGAQIGHHLESLAITFAICVCQSTIVFGLRLDSWLHEVINFLRHYESASLAARMPINLVLAIGFGLNLIIVVIARRLKSQGHHD